MFRLVPSRLTLHNCCLNVGASYRTLCQADRTGQRCEHPDAGQSGECSPGACAQSAAGAWAHSPGGAGELRMCLGQAAAQTAAHLLGTSCSTQSCAFAWDKLQHAQLRICLGQAAASPAAHVLWDKLQQEHSLTDRASVFVVLAEALGAQYGLLLAGNALLYRPGCTVPSRNSPCLHGLARATA